MTPVDIITSKEMSDIAQIVKLHDIDVPLVAVYCGSRKGNDPVYVQSAHELGRALVEAGLGLVYGGAVIGCMGAVADGVIEKRHCRGRDSRIYDGSRSGAWWADASAFDRYHAYP